MVIHAQLCFVMRKPAPYIEIRSKTSLQQHKMIQKIRTQAHFLHHSDDRIIGPFEHRANFAEHDFFPWPPVCKIFQKKASI
jgi:hypothetical protein